MEDEDTVGGGSRPSLGSCGFIHHQLMLRKDLGKKNVGLEISVFGIDIQVGSSSLVH